MAAVRLSRLQTRILRWLAADEQRTRGMITSSHPELVAALPSAKGNRARSHFSGQASSRARCEVAIRFNIFHRPAL